MHQHLLVGGITEIVMHHIGAKSPSRILESVKNPRVRQESLSPPRLLGATESLRDRE